LCPRSQLLCLMLDRPPLTGAPVELGHCLSNKREA
jgi:hypothetical protein